MTDSQATSPLMPGFEFLQNLVKGAGAALPNVGQWVAPTLDPAELDKRIQELRTVQFWLEQNARMMATTIQALEVQRMTLSTLQTMNVSFGDLTDALRIKVPETAKPAPGPKPASAPAAAAPAPKAAPAGVIDPMQWWGAVTKQFTELATQALKETGAAAAARPTAEKPAKAAPPKRAARAAKKAEGQGAKAEAAAGHPPPG
jgi:hypothetical protein